MTDSISVSIRTSELYYLPILSVIQISLKSYLHKLNVKILLQLSINIDQVQKVSF